MIGAIGRTPAASAIGQPASNGRYEQAGQCGHPGIIRHYERTVRNDQSAGVGTARAGEYTSMAGATEHIKMAGAAGYVDAARNAMPIRMAGVTRYTGRDDQAGAVRQHAFDGHYEHTIRGGIARRRRA